MGGRDLRLIFCSASLLGEGRKIRSPEHTGADIRVLPIASSGGHAARSLQSVHEPAESGWTGAVLTRLIALGEAGKLY